MRLTGLIYIKNQSLNLPNPNKPKGLFAYWSPTSEHKFEGTIKI